MRQGLFGIALRNIKAYGRMNFKLVFTFACLAFLICLFTVYYSSITIRKDETEREHLSSNVICTQTKETKAAFDNMGLDYVYCDSFKSRYFRSETAQLYGYSKTDLTTANINLVVNGKEYKAFTTASAACWTEPKPEPNYGYDSSESSLFYQYDYVELKQRFGFDSFFLSGGSPLKEDEFVICENILDTYELTPEDVMNKEVSAYLKPQSDSDKEPLLLFSARTSGVIRKEYNMLYGRVNDAHARPGFIFNSENSLFNSKTYSFNRMYLKNWIDEETAADWLKNYGNAYMGLKSIKTITGLSGVKTLSTNLYVIIGCALFISLILTVFLMIDKYMKIFSKFGGILLTLGLKQNRLLALLALQLLTLCIIAIPASFIMTLAGYGVINAIVETITRISLSISIGHLIAILAIGIIIVNAIAFLFFAYVALHLRKKTIKELLVTVVD